MLTNLLSSPTDFPAKVHLVGVCGAGMKALAEYLVDCGWHVSGCDGDPDPQVMRSLAGLGVNVQTGHACEHLSNSLRLLIYSPAVGPQNVERMEAARRNLPTLSYVEALSQLTWSLDAVAIAGTHGKSTTTAMLGQILKSANFPASVLCGGESLQQGRSGWAETGRTLIVEACEFRRHFLNLRPHLACLLGIEADHFDCYPTLHDAESAYREFAMHALHPCFSTSDGSGDTTNVSTASIDATRMASSASSEPPCLSDARRALIVRSDCPTTQRVIHGLTGRIITFSLVDSHADWQAVHRRPAPQGLSFCLQHSGVISEEFRLAVPGLHNVQNALAAAACASELGLPVEQIVSGLRAFRGLRRRFEILGTWRGARIVDDYAHHPTEVRATLIAARAAFPDKKLICLFQPHQLSRTSALLEDFAAALSLADRVYLLPVYAAREIAGEEQFRLSQELLGKITVPASLISALDRVWRTVQTDANMDAVFLTLGAGSLSRIHHDDIERVK